MRTMYREEVARRKLPSVLASFVLLAVFIYIADAMETLIVGSKFISMLANVLLVLAMLAINVYAVMRCRIKYRYSIIADQLVIHRISNDEQIVVENIKLKDIEFVGKKINLTSNLYINHTYNCSFLMIWTYCCMYKFNDKYRRFYFQPSDNFIDKLNSVVQNEKKKVC